MIKYKLVRKDMNTGKMTNCMDTHVSMHKAAHIILAGDLAFGGRITQSAQTYSGDWMLESKSTVLGCEDTATFIGDLDYMEPIVTCARYIREGRFGPFVLDLRDGLICGSNLPATGDTFTVHQTLVAMLMYALNVVHFPRALLAVSWEDLFAGLDLIHTPCLNSDKLFDLLGVKYELGE